MEPTITSASNSIVKQIRKLMTSSKARQEANSYVAEGIHLVGSFLGSGQFPALCVYAESALKNHEVTELILKVGNETTQHSVLADSLFESIASIHASVGILIVFSPAAPTYLSELNSSAVMLENIQDPGNLGTILRTVAAVGIENILLSPGCTSPWSPKALRAGMGAQFGLAIHEDADLISFTKHAKIPVLATTLTPTSKSLIAADLRLPVAWIFGNEGQGVSEELASYADESIFIPQATQSVDSLNVAAAVAVCVYEQYRQNSLL